ncbi:MAG: tetratricopeptide repeat protein [Verrucomicrobiales bacterium]|nr:tetratricopeptide repeat protein [Verrucomicrobiales bacterium]
MKSTRPRATPVSVSGSGGAVRRRKPVLAGFLLALACAVGLGAVWWSRRAPPPPAIDLSGATGPVRRTVETHLAALREQPRSAWAWGRLGSVLHAYRMNAPALRALAEAERRDPSNPRWPYLQALVLGPSEPARAIALLRRTVVLVGDQPPAPRLRLARALAEQGRWDEARPEIEALLRSDPSPAHALLLAAQDARQRGDLAGAIAWARRASVQEATAKPGWNLLASLLTRTGDAAGAAEAVERARTASGGDLFVDPFDAEALALREDPMALSERVHPLMARGQTTAAAEVVARMIADHPDYPDTWLAAGRLEYLRKDLEKAEAHLRKHLELDASSVQGRFQLGMVLLARNRNAEAADVFETAVRAKPDLGPAWHNRGLALGRLGRVDEALAAFREVLRCSPEHLDAYVLAADLQIRKGNRAEALTLLQRAERLNPTDPRLAALRQRAESPR